MEQLLFLLVFIVAALINILVRWARQQAETLPRDSTPERPRPAERRERPRAVPPRAPLPRPELPVSAPRRPQPGLPAEPVRWRQPVHPRLGRDVDIRRAIVTMTILAPCRALEGGSDSTVPRARR
jgi:hypothetical protein